VRERVLPLVLSLAFLAGAVFSGASVSSRIRVDTFRHVETVGSGFQRLKHFAASALYLQLDDYHHIEMYQGIPWNQVTDYLPQMWLIARLDPHFTDVYTDAAFHLAVNLGQVTEGMDFIREGVASNPDSLDVRYEYAYLLWQTGTGTPLEIMNECLDYRRLLRNAGGDLQQPYCEASSATLMAEVREALADSADPAAAFYRARAAFLRRALREGLYYPGYLGTPPEFIQPETMMEHQ